MYKIWQLLYRSESTYEMSATDLLALLLESRDFNHHHTLSGLLLSRNGHFMQLLEGECAEVHELFGKISRDSRHHDLILEYDGSSESRLFPDWSMAYIGIPEIDGVPVMAGSESENAALEALRALPHEQYCVGLLQRFLEGEFNAGM